MKKFILSCALLITFSILFAGCTSNKDITELAKQTQEGKAFLAAYPNAQITAVKLSNETVASMIDEIRKDCDTSIPIQEYWRVKFTDAGSNTELTIWIDAEKQEPICLVRKLISTNTGQNNSENQTINTNNTAGCTYSSDCQSGYCVNGACSATGANKPLGSTCVSTGECMSPYICINGICSTSGSRGYCGDGTCNNAETSSSCPSDCGGGGYCGNGVCQYPETVTSCPSDCGGGGYCGDGICNNMETPQNCSTDCRQPQGYCGDGVCNSLSESSFTCSQDCQPRSCTRYDTRQVFIEATNTSFINYAGSWESWGTTMWTSHIGDKFSFSFKGQHFAIHITFNTNSYPSPNLIPNVTINVSIDHQPIKTYTYSPPPNTYTYGGVFQIDVPEENTQAKYDNIHEIEVTYDNSWQTKFNVQKIELITYNPVITYGCKSVKEDLAALGYSVAYAERNTGQYSGGSIWNYILVVIKKEGLIPEQGNINLNAGMDISQYVNEITHAYFPDAEVAITLLYSTCGGRYITCEKTISGNSNIGGCSENYNLPTSYC